MSESPHDQQPQPKLPEWPQFRISDLLVVMIGAAVGLAGGTWVPADLFAAILGLITLIGLLAVHLFPPRTRTGKLLWATVVLAYVTAVGAALVKA